MNDKPKRVAIFGTSPNIHATRRIREELENFGIAHDFISHRDLLYTSEQGVLHRGKPLDCSVYDVAFFRTAGYTDDELPFSFRLENEIRVLTGKLLEADVPFVNDKLIREYPFYNKFTQSQIFHRYKIRTPRTFHINHNQPEKILEIMKELGFDFPLVIKRSSGSQGASVYLVSEEAALRKILYQKRAANLIFQEYLPNKEDFRALYVNGEVLGIMRRRGEGDWRNNFSLGGKVDFFQDREMSSFAAEICRRVGFDNAGVDIIVHDGKYYCLEVNLTPGFEGFEKAIGVNVAEKFVKLLIDKSLQRNS